MPTLIRLLVLLLIIAGLVFGAMVALAMFVDPGQREVRVRIPARDLGVQQQTTDPLGLRPAPAVPPVQPAQPAPAAQPADDVQTVELPPE